MSGIFGAFFRRNFFCAYLQSFSLFHLCLQYLNSYSENAIFFETRIRPKVKNIPNWCFSRLFQTRFVTSTSQGQKFQKFEEYPKSVRIKMADLAGRWNRKGSTHNAKKTPPDHREDRKAAKEDIQKQKLANTPVLCHQNRKIARMSRKRDEEEGAIFAWVEPKAQNSLRTVQNASPVLFCSILADFQVFVNGKPGRCWF